MKSAFTLIELLVVISIVALLAAILFPVFSKARDASRKATCLSNMRQLGLAFFSYGADFDEGFPNTGDPYLWVGRRFRWPIMPYLGIGQKQISGGFSANAKSALLRCPSDPSARSFDDTSYAYSAAFYHSPTQINRMRLTDIIPTNPVSPIPCITQTIASVATPSQKIICLDWNNSHDFTGAKSPVGPWGSANYTTRTPGDDRWSGGRVGLFVDGHAKFLTSRSIQPTTEDMPDPNLTKDGVAGSDVVR